MTTRDQVHVRSVRDEPASGDGHRVLVDRVWPRGVSKEDAALDDWLKEVGPSTELRQWFGHDPEKFDEFARRYEKELAGNEDWQTLQDLVAEHGRVTLLFGASDKENNQAVVLRDLLTR
ncbi:DUF488 family protein [Janibacter cremeus]|uniref:DUF488 domain-containing protein n=1 Tax=Janibacter cremeus TaxID=1285192 RepID=UPI0023F61FED|nr:DUF488 family protein [Janibacter cremeus]WEV78053.1 DUF488 family protein [Janibacter cremeus]